MGLERTCKDTEIETTKIEKRKVWWSRMNKKFNRIFGNKSKDDVKEHDHVNKDHANTEDKKNDK